MKSRYFPIICALAAGLTVSSCADSWLEPELRGTDLEQNFYKNETEAFKGLVAVYDVVGWQGGGYVTRTGMANAASDDHFAGGGGASDVNDLQVMTRWELTPEIGPHNDLWRKGFSGIFRANKLLEKLPAIPMDEAKKARFAAECKFLRAYFYFDLVRMFKNIPLFVKPVEINQMFEATQAAPAEVWAQIEKDLKEAIGEAQLPDRIPPGDEKARVTKGAAHALLGKVYIYQEKWAAAATELALVNAIPGMANPTYGYKLLTNFGDLFKSTPQFKFNEESIFEISYTNTSQGTWDCVACTEGNVLNIMTGPRSYTAKTADAPDYVSGWSFLTVTKELYAVMKDDPRFPYTIADLKALVAAGKASYSPGHDDTGYFLEKFAGRASNRVPSGIPELNFPQNIYDMRLADTYLLEAEALVRQGQGGGAGSRAYALLNAVRGRVGLLPVEATIDNIFLERRKELAGEGHRFFDLLRTKQAGVVLKARGFDEKKNYVFPIPFNDLQSTKMEQNKEWGGSK